MNFFDMNKEGCDLRAEEELIVASFTRRLVEIAAVSGARGSGSSPTAAFNAIRLPAIALDRKGIVVDVNAAAEVVFDNNIKIKDRRLFVRDLDSRNLLKEAIDQLANPSRPNPLALEPVIIPRTDKLPVIVRIWPFGGPAQPPAQEVLALLTLNALGPRPGPPATILAKTFCRPGTEDFARDCAQSVEIRVRQDGHASAKRTRSAANASLVLLMQVHRSNFPNPTLGSRRC